MCCTHWRPTNELPPSLYIPNTQLGMKPTGLVIKPVPAPFPEYIAATEPSAFSVILTESSAFSAKIDNTSVQLSEYIGDNKPVYAKKPKREVGLLHPAKHAIAGFVREFFAQLADLGRAAATAAREGLRDTKIVLKDLKNKAAAKLQPASAFIEKLWLRRSSGPTSASAPSATASAGNDEASPSADSSADTASEHEDDSALETPATSKTKTVADQAIAAEHVATGGTAVEPATLKTSPTMQDKQPSLANGSETVAAKETGTEHVATGGTDVETGPVENTPTTQDTKAHGSRRRAPEASGTCKDMAKKYNAIQPLSAFQAKTFPVLGQKPIHFPLKANLNTTFFTAELEMDIITDAAFGNFTVDSHPESSICRVQADSFKTPGWIYAVLCVMPSYLVIFLIYWIITLIIARADCLSDFIPPAPLPPDVLSTDDYYGNRTAWDEGPMTAEFVLDERPVVTTADFITWFGIPREVLHGWATENPVDYMSIAEKIIPNLCSSTVTSEETAALTSSPVAESVYTETLHQAVYGQDEIIVKRALDFFAEYNGVLAFMGGRQEQLATLMRAIPTLIHLAKRGRATRRDLAALQAVIKDCQALSGVLDSRTVGALVKLVYPLEEIFFQYDQMGLRTRMAQEVYGKPVREAAIEVGEGLLTCVRWTLDGVY